MSENQRKEYNEKTKNRMGKYRQNLKGKTTSKRTTHILTRKENTGGGTNKEKNVLANKGARVKD